MRTQPDRDVAMPFVRRAACLPPIGSFEIKEARNAHNFECLPKQQPKIARVDLVLVKADLWQLPGVKRKVQEALDGNDGRAEVGDTDSRADVGACRGGAGESE